MWKGHLLRANAMNDSKDLLASSYASSAKRIWEALQGGMAVRNSRVSGQPPSILDEVVGLCGQGGRHPYFRLTPSVLRAAVARILQSGSMEEISAACQDLRQQTYFDTGTGCVNDQFPSMVPLLPPEEIWLNGQELPLDIWRLISFEFDLVSSAVASQVSVQDFAFAAVNQNALAFRYLINQAQRRVTFEVQWTNIPAGW